MEKTPDASASCSPSLHFENFLQNFLEEKFSQFKKIVEKTSQEERCAIQQAFNLKTWDPDYSEEAHRVFYFLKYTVQYCVEYREIYREIIKLFAKSTKDISVISIGCGSMLDLVGLSHASAECRYSPRISYHGIDLVDWSCPETSSFKNIETKFTCSDIKDVSPHALTTPCNVIIFPKSISDIPLEAIEKFISALPDSILSPALLLVLSRRGVSKDDLEKAENICNILAENHSYHLHNKKCLLGEQCFGEKFTDYLDESYCSKIEDMQKRISLYLQNIQENLCDVCIQDCTFSRPFMKKIAYEYMDYNTGISYRRINAEPIIYYLQRHGN